MAGRPPWMEASPPWMKLNIPRPGQCPNPGPMSPRRRLWTDGDPVWIQVGQGAGKSHSTSLSKSTESGFFSISLSGKSEVGTSGPPVTPLNDRLKEFDKISAEPENETAEAERTTASHDNDNRDNIREDPDQGMSLSDAGLSPCDVTTGGDISVRSPECEEQIRKAIGSNFEEVTEKKDIH
ncbi:uncharacterized protein LOC135497041 [Lineus longissimus]|uniref:uncharacterized protein LOC135497041 n=1 Tax=Lineus longissimus TaxID=88925 RepID=UPI002B4DEF1B